jgi:hypothetical protein
MTDSDPNLNQRQTPVMKALATQIGNLSHQLLSTSEYTESLQIATALIAAIHSLLDARRDVDRVE